MTLAIILTVVAFALVTLELVFPSFGFLSLCAATAYTFSLILAFREGSAVGWTFVGTGVLLFPVAVMLGLHVLPKTPIGRALFLSGPRGDEIQHGTRDASAAPELVGVVGTALTDLRPSGAAEANGRRIDVVAGGDFVPRGARVRVTSVDGYRITVVPADDVPAGSES